MDARQVFMDELEKIAKARYIKEVAKKIPLDPEGKPIVRSPQTIFGATGEPGVRSSALAHLFGRAGEIGSGQSWAESAKRYAADPLKRAREAGGMRLLRRLSGIRTR